MNAWIFVRSIFHFRALFLYTTIAFVRFLYHTYILTLGICEYHMLLAYTILSINCHMNFILGQPKRAANVVPAVQISSGTDSNLL